MNESAVENAASAERKINSYYHRQLPVMKWLVFTELFKVICVNKVRGR